MGAVVNNGNMGCVALTYSLINSLYSISKKTYSLDRYVIFEHKINLERVYEMCRVLEIPKEQVSVVQYGTIGSIKNFIRHGISNCRMIKAIKECDVIIDLTQGDSFTDIYGDYRFNSWTNIKRLVEIERTPLILGPQTYGPFNKEKNRKKAIRVIEKASHVISRDKMSADYIRMYSNKHVDVTTDLAFSLPYDNTNDEISEKIKIGLNISGLLVRDKTESTDILFSLKTDYDEYVSKLAEFLNQHSNYEVHLIPHVIDDVVAIKKIAEKYPSFIMHEMFTNPIQAKTCISKMDIFIGARMHATIASFSSGVVTIPTAYSRKFKGLFENLGYNYLIDLCSMNTEESVYNTINYIEHYKELKASVNIGVQIAKDNAEKTNDLLFNQIKSISSQL